ncbi:NUDIX hydrolase [Halocatena salina]|uniref:NUDIX hydrolase n=1 Tax=Halocatena salina TaxID=2934340 RepID=A0A8U0A3C5_9EURY|nr:NUDIX hydrolase [Halocatena salina]UPM43602.1 NUDIX hydrolase [Halocatena salina]
MRETEPSLPDGWRRIESVTEYETGWYTGGYDRLEQPDGTEKSYYWAALPPAVVVVARDESELVMVEQYRPPIERLCLELPAGIVDVEDHPEAGEPVDTPGGLSPTADVPPAVYETAGRRELREETGTDPNEIVFLEEVWIATGLLTHRRGYVFATDLEPADRDLDANEFITVKRVSVDDALTVARTDPTTDATLEGLLLADQDGLL